MKQTRQRGTRAVILCAFFLGAAAFMQPGLAAAQGVEGYETTFRPIVADEVVEIETVFQTGGRQRITTYIPVEATEIGSDVAIQVDELEFDAYYEVQLDVRGSNTATLSYEIPSGEGRSAGDTRVNSSHISFFVSVDPFLAGGSAKLVIPAGFDALIDPSLMQATASENGDVVWTAEAIEDPLNFFFQVVARNSAGFSESTVVVEGQTVGISAWAGDVEWEAFATDIVRRGVPVLTDLIGQPWPEDDLVVIESAAPSSEGYAGWYDIRESVIEVGDVLDQETMLHELSHAWFNGTRFSERWMIEGFAEVFSAEASAALGGDPFPAFEPVGTAPLDGLATWRSRFFFEDTWDIEYYGYDTSYFVMDRLADEVGIEGLSLAVGAMLDGRLLYATPDEPAVFPTNDWRRFLDALEHGAGSETAASIFETYVVPAADRDLLRRRATTTETFESFVEETAPLAAPAGVRDSMSRWRFSRAEQQMASAREALVEIEAIENRAAVLGLMAPPYLADLYESSDGSFAIALSALDDANRALDAIEARGPAAVNADRDRANFERGRLEQIELAEIEISGLNQGASTGRSYRPYLIGLGGLILLLAIAVVAAARIDQRPVPTASPGRAERADPTGSAGSISGPPAAPVPPSRGPEQRGPV